MDPECTRQLVAEMKTTRRNAFVHASCVAAATLLGFVLVVSLSSDALGDVRPVVVVPENIDLVEYPLPTACTLTDLARELWQGEVSPYEVLRFNAALPDVSTRLEAGTLVTVPNFREFPVEALAALP